MELFNGFFRNTANFSACAARSANLGARLLATTTACSAVRTGAERTEGEEEITRKFIVKSLAIDFEVNRIERGRAAYKQTVALDATKRQI